MSEYVQYIVVRKDLIEQMGIGKTAAQVAHASLGAVIERHSKVVGRTCLWGCKGITVPEFKEETRIINDPGVKEWFSGRFTKLVVYVKTKQKLLNLYESLDKLDIRTKLIYDACFTALQPEEENGTTLTCMGVIPLSRDNVPKCLKKLRLLE